MPERDDRHGGPAGDPLRYATSYHAPVLYRTVVRELVTDPAGLYVDATLGGGGHAAALLEALADEGVLVLGVKRPEEDFIGAPPPDLDLQTGLSRRLDGHVGGAGGDVSRPRGIAVLPFDAIGIVWLAFTAHALCALS